MKLEEFKYEVRQVNEVFENKIMNTMNVISKQMNCLVKNQIPTIKSRYYKLKIYTSEL